VRFHLSSAEQSMHSSTMARGRFSYKFLLLLVLLLAHLSALHTANADPDPIAKQESTDPLAKPSNRVAREHLAQGNRLYRIREFEKAIEEYKDGALIEDTPVFQYNLGQSYRMAGRYEEALWHYNQFMNRTRPRDPYKSAIEMFIAQMKAELEKAATKQPPTAPATGMKSESSHMVRPRAGFSRNSSRWYDDTSGWILTLSGAAAVAVALYLFVDANKLSNDALSENKDIERGRLQDRARDRMTTGYIAGSIGLPILAIGSVKLALHSRATEPVSFVVMAGRF
jgi:tetratricopeptide (TPR) repeat protein